MSNMSIITFVGIVLLVFILCGIIYFLFWYNQVSKNQTQKIKQDTNHKTKVEEFNQTLQLLSNYEEYPEHTEYTEPQVRRSYQKERDLYELFFKGIPDEYDLDGNLMKGVEPDANKAIEYLTTVINSPEGTDKDVLNLAKIYHYGMHKFDVDLNKTEEIYQDLKFSPSANEEIRQTIREALVDINKIKVYSWLNLPLERPATHTQQPYVQLPEQRQPIRHVTEGELILIPGQHRNQMHNQMHNQLNQPNLLRVRQVNNQDDRNTKGYNDPQNTHNSQVLSTIRLSIDKLKQGTRIVKGPEETLTEIRAYIHLLKESDKKQDAIRSLNEIVKNREKLSSTDMTEMEALNLVWNRIHDRDKFEESVANNLKENLFDELASIQEHGTSVCATGRFTHIVDTLSGVDNDVSIKPTYAINEEMMNTAARVRTEMMALEPETERNLLERGTSTKQTEFDQLLKNTIVNKLKEDYVTTKILSEVAFSTEVDKWIDSI